ncbi:MAG: PAS domain S-box protein [Bacteroidia bacterium]|nr:PAS domain S-box protein [Bacteroidia bacterium]
MMQVAERRLARLKSEVRTKSAALFFTLFGIVVLFIAEPDDFLSGFLGDLPVAIAQSAIALAALAYGGYLYYTLGRAGAKDDDAPTVNFEQAQTPEENKFKVLVQNAQDVIFIVETNGTLRFQSPSAEKTLGYAPRELIGQNLFDVVHAEDQSILKNALERQGAVVFTIRFQHRDGQWLHFETYSNNLTDHPHIQGVVLTARDVTQRKKEEALLREKEIAAQKLTAEKDAAEQEKKLIEEKSRELEKAYKTIQEQTAEITDGINYAFKIQTALQPKMEEIQRTLPNSFVILRPKEIVSGDFYWYAHKNGKSLLAIADCTGHGVPGAFMTIIGHTLLNQIVNEHNVLFPDEILTRLNIGVRTLLQQDRTDSQSRDGMEIALMVVEHAANVVYYAGANLPLIQIRKGELIEHAPEKKGIGGKQTEALRTYAMHKIAFQSGDAFYMFSDGLQDQFGGPEGKKFMITRLKDTLKQIAGMPAIEQKAFLNQTIADWMGTKYQQLDDISIAGVIL